MKAYVFATGMFRSGTTLLARLLNACQHVAFASDPFLPIFKSCRNAVAQSHNLQIDPDAPLEDYYYHTERRKLLEAIEKEKTDLPLENIKEDEFRNKVVTATAPYSPKISDHIQEMEFHSLKRAIETGFDIILKAYGDENTHVVGFKEVWTGEFTRPLLKMFPQMRVIYMVRDPRAVCASKQAQQDKYPFTFLCRQWRKLASIAWMLQQETQMQDKRFLLLRYEDLISKPEPTIKNLCDFLDIPFTDNLLDPATFRDGSGSAWVQNSSHFSNNRTFNVHSIDKWRDTLTEKEIEFIEMACHFEMQLFGYENEVFDPAQPSPSTFLDPLIIPQNLLAQWIRKYSLTDPHQVCADMALEYARFTAIAENQAHSEDHKRSLVLYAQLYDTFVQKA